MPRVGSSRQITPWLGHESLADHDLLLIAAGEFSDQSFEGRRLHVETLEEPLVFGELRGGNQAILCSLGHAAKKAKD